MPVANPATVRPAAAPRPSRRDDRRAVTTYLLDWCGLLVRWLHLIAGIAWIGSSFYFVWLDNHLQPPNEDDPANAGVAGELWAVHGGGFYRSRKYRIAPAVLPPTLHWFYWEAYTTWLSGFALLSLLYFFRAEAYLIDPAVAPLTKTTAIVLAMSVLVGSWLIYDLLCRSPLGRSPRALAVDAGGRDWRGGVGAVPGVQRTRRFHDVRRGAGHDHGGQCVS